MPEDAKLWEVEQQANKGYSSTVCSQEGSEGGRGGRREKICGYTNCLFVNSTQLTQLTLCLSMKTNKG